jgi:hypothetical protein
LRKRFDWKEVTRVNQSYGTNNSLSVVLEGKNRVTVASGINETRQYFLLQTLRCMLACRGKPLPSPVSDAVKFG